MKRDKETFLSVLEGHKLIIFKVCHSYCHDAEDQKDLVQEVILQLWNSFDAYDEQYKLSTWIYRIALNTAISFHRKTSTRQKNLSAVDLSFVQIAQEDDRETLEEVKLLRHFINQLDELNRALMILYLDGYSHDEIAGILNITKSNVGTKINRIKNQLKKQFCNIQA